MTPYRFTAPIETDRLVLRSMTPADTDDVHAWMSDPEVVRYLLHDVRSREDVATRVAEYAAATSLAVDGDFVQLAVELRGERVIGAIYFTVSDLKDSAAEIGWAFTAAYHGRGYAAESAAAMLDVAFGQIGSHRVAAQLHPDNAASAALCERLGMRREAHLIENTFVKGAWEDTVVYGILEREWRAARAG